MLAEFFDSVYNSFIECECYVNRPKSYILHSVTKTAGLDYCDLVEQQHINLLKSKFRKRVMVLVILK